MQLYFLNSTLFSWHIIKWTFYSLIWGEVTKCRYFDVDYLYINVAKWVAKINLQLLIS